VNKTILEALKDSIVSQGDSYGCQAVFQETLLGDGTFALPSDPIDNHEKEFPSRSLEATKNDSIEIMKLGEIAQALPIENDHHSALHRWASKDVEEAIDAGNIGSLILELSSTELALRKEALSNLRHFALKVKTSAYSERNQIWLLIQELLETAQDVIDHEPLPSALSAFATRAILVLRDPLHLMYPKVNRFLQKAPNWDIDQVPLLRIILFQPPDNDIGRYNELEWLLDVLYDGLRTSKVR
jgi:nucleolar pre-ribosomal-associated protein 1